MSCCALSYLLELHSATAQLDALQESADETTRRYAREALWNLKFFEVPSSVVSHFTLTGDAAGEIVLSPNARRKPKGGRGAEHKPASDRGVEGGGDDGGRIEGEELESSMGGGAEASGTGASTRAFRGAYQTPASARVAFLAEAVESAGLSMANMLHAEFFPVNHATGNIGPAAITPASEALNLARPAARDAVFGKDFS